MSLLSRIKRSLTNARNPQQWFINFVNGGSASSSGVVVSEASAMTYTPFWAAVRIISGAVAGLPLITYRKTDDGKERAENEIPFTLLKDVANPYMTSFKLKETLQAHALVYGNGYANIERDGGGRPIALWPLLPNQTKRVIGDDGVPHYEVGIPGMEPRTLLDDDVLHIAGLGFDGLSGYNVVRLHKEAIGLGMATKQYSAAFFSNGAQPAGILEHPGEMTEQAQKRFRKSWEEQHKGLTRSHRIAILEEGMKYTQTGVNPEDAQSLEMQKFSVDDVARIFNIPPHKLASMDRATFSNIEEQNMDFLTQTLLYWLKGWETECNKKLIMPSRRGKVFVEYLVDAFLRGDLESRYKAYNTGRLGGWLSVNEIRGFENMNNIGDEGDIYLEPLNMKPAGTVTPGPAPVVIADEEDERHLCEDVWAGLLVKESKAIQKMARKPDTFLACAEAFYAEHTAHIYKVIEPVLRVKYGASDSNIRAWRMAQDYTNKAIADVRGHITQKSDMIAVTALWEATAPRAMATKMIGASND